MASLEPRLAAGRGRMALAAAVEDAQRGLPYGAAAALVAGALHAAGLVAFAPGEVLTLGAAGTLTLPVIALLLRRTPPERVASLLDERLGLEERVSTAWSVETGAAPASPLTPLLAEDAEAALAAVPAAAMRRAFRPRVHRNALLLGAAVALAAAVVVRIEPAIAAGRAAPVETPRERAEKEEAARAARRVREEAAKIEEEAERTQDEVLRAAAAAMRREAEAMLERKPPVASAMAAFTRMGEAVREAQERLAGTTLDALARMKASGALSAADRELSRLLQALMAAGLDDLAGEMKDLDRALAGVGGEPFDADRLQSLLERIGDLEEALRRAGTAMEGREGLREGLGMFGDPDLLRELAGRMSELLKTLREQGWEPCRAAFPDGMQAGLGGGPGAPPTLTREQLQAMIERLREMQRLAELGQLAFCQNCSLAPGGT